MKKRIIDVLRVIKYYNRQIIIAIKMKENQDLSYKYNKSISKIKEINIEIHVKNK